MNMGVSLSGRASKQPRSVMNLTSYPIAWRPTSMESSESSGAPVTEGGRVRLVNRPRTEIVLWAWLNPELVCEAGGEYGFGPIGDFPQADRFEKLAVAKVQQTFGFRRSPYGGTACHARKASVGWLEVRERRQSRRKISLLA